MIPLAFSLSSGDGVTAVLFDASDPADRAKLLAAVSVLTLLLDEALAALLTAQQLEQRQRPPSPCEQPLLRLLEGGQAGLGKTDLLP